MSHAFIHPHFPQAHAGVIRAERAFSQLQRVTRALWSSRGASTLVLSGVVSALVLGIGPHLQGELQPIGLAAWVNAWAVAFGALMLLAQPVRRTLQAVARTWARLRERQRVADADAQLWEWAERDPRVMAELRAALARG